MKFINFFYEILETFLEVKNCSFSYIYDHNTNQRYIGIILNNITNDDFNELFDLYLENKYNSLPFIKSPNNIQKIYYIDDFYINTHSVLILFDYFEFRPLSKINLDNNEKIEVLKKLVFIVNWANKVNISIGNISLDYIILDNNNYPYFILIKGNSNLSKDLYFLSNIASNQLKIYNYEPVIKDQLIIDEEKFNYILHYYSNNFKISIDFFEPLIKDIKNEFNNFIYKNDNYNLYSFINFEVKNNFRFSNNPHIINLAGFPSYLSILISNLIEDLSIKHNIIFLNLNGTPDKFSLLYDFIEKTSKNLYTKSFIDYNNIIINKLYHKHDDIIKFQIKKIINELIELIETITKSYNIIIFINNFDYMDKFSLEFLMTLYKLENSNIAFFINTLKYNELKFFKIITYKHFINLDENKNLFEYFVNFLIKFSFIANEEKENLANLNLDKLIFILQNNFTDFLILKNNNIFFNQKKISNLLLNKEIGLIFKLIQNIDLKIFSLYFYYFDKPSKIEYFKNIEGHNLIPIINFLIKNKILINIDEGRFLPADIRITRMLVLEYISQKHNKKKILENVCKIYLQNFDNLNNNEIYALILYLIEIKNYEFAAEIFYQKVLYKYFVSNHFINEKEYFELLKKVKNRTLNFKKLKDNLSSIIFQISYYLIYYKNNSNKITEKLDLLLNKKDKLKNNYIILFSKLFIFLTYGKINESKDIVETIEKYQDLFNNTDLKIYYSLISSYYFLNFKTTQTIEISKKFIRFLYSFNEIDKENELYLNSIYKISYSLLYQQNHKKSKAYSNYLYKIAIKYDNKYFIFRALSNLGTFYYRSKKYYEASIYLLKAYEISLKLFDNTLYFVALNNKNLLEIDIKQKINVSYKALKISKSLHNINYFALALCNYTINCYNGLKFNKINAILKKYFNSLFNENLYYNNNYLRRILQFSIIISNFLIVNKEENYIITIFYNLLNIYENIKKDHTIIEEILDLYYFSLSFYKYIIFDLLKIDLKKINFNLNYLNDIEDFASFLKKSIKSQQKLINIDLIYEIIFDFGYNILGREYIIESLLDTINNNNNNLNFIPPNIILYLKLSKTNKSEEIVYRYLNKYFKLKELDYWFSSSNYIKIFLFYKYVKCLKSLNNKYLNYYLKKLTLYKKHLEKVYLDSSLFPHYNKLLSKIESFIKDNSFINIKYRQVNFFNNYSFYILNFNKNKSFNNILVQLLDDLNFDRIIFFQNNGNNDFKIEFEYYNKNIFFLNNEPINMIWKNDLSILSKPQNFIFKNSEIFQIIIIPIYNNKYYRRHLYNNNFSDINLLTGFIYLDKKINIKTNIDINHLYLLSLLISNYYISIKNENFYMKDRLTELYLKDVFINKTLEYFEKSEISKNHCLLMVDIDDFKKINDTFGHQKGDFVLKCIANTITKSLRSYDFVGRYGGEEFIIFLPNTDIKNGFFISERIRKNIELLKIQGIPYSMTVSIGISSYPEDGFILEELINKADKALYFAKSLGKNRSIVYQE
ncbi:MAG: GGDEF domain-containing protein [Spirochaetes bacterium]|nr:GGDEF domain-containing protein [Spirochaetota bacterium]